MNLSDWPIHEPQRIYLTGFVAPRLASLSCTCLQDLSSSNRVSEVQAAEAWLQTERWLNTESTNRRPFGALTRQDLTHELSPYFMGRSGKASEFRGHKSSNEYQCCKILNTLCPSSMFFVKSRFEDFRKLLECCARKLGLLPKWRDVEVQTKPDACAGSVVYPSKYIIDNQLQIVFEFIKDNYHINSHLCAIVLLVGISHIHPLQDGNGRLSRVMYNWLSFSEINSEFYLPLYEIGGLSEGGYVIRKRLARNEDGWDSIIKYITMLNNKFLWDTSSTQHMSNVPA